MHVDSPSHCDCLVVLVYNQFGCGRAVVCGADNIFVCI